MSLSRKFQAAFKIKRAIITRFKTLTRTPKPCLYLLLTNALTAMFVNLNAPMMRFRKEKRFTKSILIYCVHNAWGTTMSHNANKFALWIVFWLMKNIPKVKSNWWQISQNHCHEIKIIDNKTKWYQTSPKITWPIIWKADIVRSLFWWDSRAAEGRL